MIYGIFKLNNVILKNIQGILRRKTIHVWKPRKQRTTTIPILHKVNKKRLLKQAEPLTRFKTNDSGNFYSEAPG